MDIAYLVTHFPVLSETFIGDEIRAMQARGHRVTLIAMTPASGPGQAVDQPLADKAIRLPEIPATVAARPTAFAAGAPQALRFVRAQRMLPRRSLLWNAARIAGVVRDAGCAHVHAHFAGGAAAHAIVAARLARVSVSFIGHGHDIYAEPEDLPAKLGHADFALAPCEDMARDLRAMAPDALIRVVPCGIDADQFPFAESGNNARLLFIGRLVPQKGVDDLLHALSDSGVPPSLCLDIAGDGPARVALEQRAETLGLADRVRFLGAQQRDWFRTNGAGYLAMAAPFKDGPNGERDTGPLVIKEAMAMGLPVISTRYMGVKEMVLPGMGLLVEPGDRQLLARALSAAMHWTDDERREMTRAARMHVERNFTLKAQAATLTQMMEAAQHGRLREKSAEDSRQTA
jgi:glycosyltransferase involved in cell wall biosynthesis